MKKRAALPVVELIPSPAVTENEDSYPTGKYITKQVADLELQVSVTEYRAQIYCNRITGERYHAPFPDGISNEFNYGKCSFSRRPCIRISLPEE